MSEMQTGRSRADRAGQGSYRCDSKRLWQAELLRVLLLLLFSIAFVPGHAAEDKQLTLNFANADINTVIQAVSQRTGMNFIVDPRVKGKVTIISQHSMNADELYQVFLSVLKVHGYAAIPGKNVVKIVPEVNAKQDAIKTVTAGAPGAGDEFVTRVIEVRYVNAAQLVPILRPLVPQRGHLAAYPASNVLIVSDSAANIRRLSYLINRIDQATSDEIEVLPLEHASSAEVVRIITQLEKADPKSKKENIKIVADERTNSILLGGAKGPRLRLRALISHLDTPMEVGGNTHVIYLNHANAKDLVPVLTGVAQGVAAAGKGGQKKAAAIAANVNIQAEESTNALVINAPPGVFRQLRSVIRKLDIRRAQVLVEAILAEVSDNFSREFGIQWAVDAADSGYMVGLINFTIGSPILGLLDDPPALGGSSGGLSTAVGDLTGNTRFGAFIRALSADAGTNILSTPNLVTLDNEEAEIVVGQNVPFVTGSFSGTGGGSTPDNPFQTIEREDVGITLRIKPQINDGNTILMDVLQEISSISDNSEAVDIITNKRSIKTNVMIEDDQILVLGGLIEDNLREQEQKVPGLGDIPLVGKLFTYEKTIKVKTNLMIFLHPTIIKDRAHATRYTTEKYNFMRGRQMEKVERGVPFTEDRDIPVLPEISSEFFTLPEPYTGSEGFREDTAPPPMRKSLEEVAR